MVTRRRVLGCGLSAVAAVSGTAAALRPMLGAAGRPPAAPGTDAAAGRPRSGPPLFDERYRGRRVQGFGPARGQGPVTVLIDGRPLGLMRRVDGSWISPADHFQPYPTPLATARGAVDAIGDAELSVLAAGHPH
jgi:Tyrosinase co-factor MelC1